MRTIINNYIGRIKWRVIVSVSRLCAAAPI